ncbi:MAG: DoxX family membrane protein [Melioribacteraceae bacterium]|nr:DoxX family membrane protein [Melioribacteraceae bacterium]
MWNNLLTNSNFQLFLRIIFASLFIFSGGTKISVPEEFAVSISNYRLLPIELVNFFAIIIPWIEIITGILLLFGFFVKENSFILTFLLGVFTIMVFIAMIRGLNIECGCFGTKGGQKVGLLKIFENLIYLVIGILIYKFSKYHKILLK